MKNSDLQINLGDENTFREIIFNQILNIQAETAVIVDYLSAIDLSLNRQELDAILRQRIVEKKAKILEELLNNYDQDGV